MKPSRIVLIFALALSLAPACFAQKLPLTLETGRLSLSVGEKRNISLKVDGVTVIRESGLYIVQPWWAGTYLDQEKVTPKVTMTLDGALTATARYETPDATAEYLYELGTDDTLKVTLRFRMKSDKPAEVEYTAGYLNADLLKGVPYTAETVDGPRKGFVPLFAKSSDQTASRLTPLLKSIRFETAIGPMEISVTGNSRVTSTLNLFDAREEDRGQADQDQVVGAGDQEDGGELVGPGGHAVGLGQGAQGDQEHGRLVLVLEGRLQVLGGQGRVGAQLAGQGRVVADGRLLGVHHFVLRLKSSR